MNDKILAIAAILGAALIIVIFGNWMLILWGNEPMEIGTILFVVVFVVGCGIFGAFYASRKK
ncbi:MAG: hypothetical protein FWG64_14090 [Firmicutes bacterium]|nr:hypothetical protein [Bacillota bacterium]